MYEPSRERGRRGAEASSGPSARATAAARPVLWGALPEDREGCAGPDGAVSLDDFQPWDVLDVDAAAGVLSVDPFDEERTGGVSGDVAPAGPWGSDEEPGRGRAPWECLAGVEDVAPDGMLALVLEQVDVTAADDALLVETVAARERVAAWAHLNGALAAGELSRRASMNPQWNLPLPTDTCVAGDELAMRLGWSKPAARRLVRDGQALSNELLPTADAVRDGDVDTFKLRTVCDRLADRPGELAWAVQEAVLENAATRTPTQLAADIDRALLTVAPEDAADRLARAQAKRRVCHPRRLPDGMAGIWAVLPADDAMVIDATLDASARAARALGDPRTLDQIRADDFTALATGRALLAGQAWPDGQVAMTAPTCDLVDDAGARSGETVAVPAQTAPRAATGIRIPQVRVDVTVALSTLLGLDENPGELAGFGPVAAEQARALAAGGIWRRLVTDPLTGRVLDVGRTRYRPPKPLADHVVARDGCCAAPGCAIPASRCDLDHTTEYHGTPANGSPEDGTTSADNLGPLSDRCHRLKTDGGFRLRQVEPGVFEWRTPAGLAYRVIPGDHGRTERIAEPGRTRRRDSGTAPHNRGYPDEPPF